MNIQLNSKTQTIYVKEELIEQFDVNDIIEVMQHFCDEELLVDYEPSGRQYKKDTRLAIQESFNKIKKVIKKYETSAIFCLDDNGADDNLDMQIEIANVVWTKLAQIHRQRKL